MEYGKSEIHTIANFTFSNNKRWFASGKIVELAQKE